MPASMNSIAVLLILATGVPALAQQPRTSAPDLAGLTCDSQTMVRLQNYVYTAEQAPSGTPTRTYEFKPTDNPNEMKLVLYFKKNDPQIVKAVQAQLAEFRRVCQNDLLNRSIRGIQEPSTVTPDNLSGTVPLMKVEVGGLERNGRLSLDLNPDRVTSLKDRASDTLTTEIVIDRNEYERLQQQNSQLFKGAGVRLSFGL